MTTTEETFNRTSVGLKQRLVINGKLVTRTFNRTSVGLKRKCTIDALCNSLLLIEPVWD